MTIISLIITGQAGIVVAQSAGAAMSPGSSATTGSAICGLKFNDLNGNGLQEPTEPGLSGFVFELLDSTGTVIALSPPSALNPLGSFCFTGVAAGTYTVREKPKVGWNQTYPSAPGTYSVTVGTAVAPPTLLFGNTKVVGTSSVCGIKFNDLNGNGAQESTEPGLGGFVFELLDAAGNVVATAISSAPLGSFCFDNVKDGWYRAREVPQLGWDQTYPFASGMWAFTADALAPAPSLSFGNKQVPVLSSACGIKFNDLNGNGVQEPTEPGLSGFVFELLDAAGNVVDTATSGPETAASLLGRFCFDRVPDGTYTVREVPQPLWSQTYPLAPGTYSMTLGAGAAPPNLLFGNTQLPKIDSICGIKFNDLNGNGVQESTEPGLSGFVFELLDANGIVVALSTLSAINPLGSFCFTGIAAGSYTVREKPKSGWNQTYPPAPGTYSVTFGHVKAPAPLLFGNTQVVGTSSVCGIKFNDLNENGAQESTEPGLSGFVFQLLDAAGNVVATATSVAPLGSFCFDNVQDGWYRAREVPQLGWDQTYPSASGMWAFTANAVAPAPSLSFGNKQVPATSTVCGIKFEDKNGNGKQDDGELGLGGWTIQVTDENGNVVAKVVTRDDGTFCFERLSLGTYTFTEVMLDGWTQTLPGGAGAYTMQLTATQLENKPLLFGNLRKPETDRVCGTKFEDKNGNGKQDDGELGLGGWTIQVTDENGNLVAKVITRDDGTFCFEPLRPGIYTFAEVMQDGYQQTFPGKPGTHKVEVAGGQNTPSIHFGNQKKPDPCCLSFSFPQGRADNFATADGAEPAQPSAALVQAMPAGAAYTGFDSTDDNKFVAHTFALPAGNCVAAATLEFKAKPMHSNSDNDAFSLRFAGAPGTPVWSAYLGAYQPSPGMLTSSWAPPNLSAANYSAGHVFSLDLASLPGGVNLIPTLNAQRFVDFVVQDDTSVDYARLTVTFCECAGFDPFDPKPVDDNVNSPRPSSGTPGVNIRLVVDSVEASVNGEIKRLSAPAVIRDGSTLLPFRGFGDLLGAAVQWDVTDQRATYELGDSKVQVWIGQRMARVNGVDFSLSIAPILIDGTTYVPLRSIVEAFGLSVTFNPDDRSITIFDRWGNL